MTLSSLWNLNSNVNSLILSPTYHDSIEWGRCSVWLFGESNHFQTVSIPAASPVKNKPPGAIWRVLTSRLENILPLSVNLELDARSQPSRRSQQSSLRDEVVKPIREMIWTYDGSSYKRTVLSLHAQRRTGLPRASISPDSARIPCAGQNDICNINIWYYRHFHETRSTVRN